MEIAAKLNSDRQKAELFSSSLCCVGKKLYGFLCVSL